MIKMKISSPDIHKIKKQFHCLKNAVIDTSSIINIEKAGFMAELQQKINLHTVEDVFFEYGKPVPSIRKHLISQIDLSTDQKVIMLAYQNSFPVISEDKGLLQASQKKDLEYYNAVMMLEYLFFKRSINNEKYRQSFSLLEKNCRYSSGIWNYIDKLHQLLLIEL
jgi:hypothetical protein